MKDNTGLTPLDPPWYLQAAPNAEALVKMKDNKGLTPSDPPLWYLQAAPNAEALVKMKDNKGRTPADVASERGFRQVIK